MKKSRRHLPVFPLPPMRCDKGCGECCGIVPVGKLEVDRIRAYIKQHAIVPEVHSRSTRCPFYQRGTCAIYEVRPAVCRAYGHSWRLECPRGYNVNVSNEAGLMRWVMAHGAPAMTLHKMAGVEINVDAVLASVKRDLLTGERR